MTQNYYYGKRIIWLNQIFEEAKKRGNWKKMLRAAELHERIVREKA